MAIELITGRAGRAHVDSSDVRAFNAYVNAGGRYVLHGGGATIESANDLHILPAEILVDGAHVRITGTGEEVTLENGASSYDRIDIVALHYTSVGSDDSRVESVALEVIKGTPVDTGGSAQDPDMPVPGTSILDGSSEVYVPYVRVKITGLVPGDPEEILPGRDQMLRDMIDGLTLSDVSGTLPISKGGTGATSGNSALSNLGIKSWLLANVFKVGFVWVSYTSTSPASILGGTWTPITGRFPYFDAGTGTGGSNTHTLSTGEMPSHNHSLRGYTWNWGVQPGSGLKLGVNDVGAVYIGDPFVENSLATIQNVYNWSNASGGGASHNNMPAYQTLYAWRRTA